MHAPRKQAMHIPAPGPPSQRHKQRSDSDSSSSSRSVHARANLQTANAKGKQAGTTARSQAGKVASTMPARRPSPSREPEHRSTRVPSKRRPGIYIMRLPAMGGASQRKFAGGQYSHFLRDLFLAAACATTFLTMACSSIRNARITLQGVWRGRDGKTRDPAAAQR